MFIISAKTVDASAYEIGTTISSSLTCRITVKKNSPANGFMDTFNSLDNADDIRDALEDSSSGFNLEIYSTLNNTQKYLAAKILFDNKGDGFIDKEAIQSALDLAVSSVIIPDSPVTSAITVAYSKDSGRDLRITVRAEYPDYRGVNENILSDGLVTISESVTTDTTVSIVRGEEVAGQYVLKANENSFWISGFSNFDARTPLKSHDIDEYTLLIQEVPPEFFNKNVTFTFGTVASIDGCFDDRDDWIKEISFVSSTVNIVEPISPFTVYVGNYESGTPGLDIIKFNSVKAAVSKVAPGGTVRINPGTYLFIDSYDDRLSISKSISIEGTDRDNTILEIYPPNYNPVQDMGAFYAFGDIDLSLSNITFNIKSNLVGTKIASIVNTRCKNTTVKDVNIINTNNNSKVEYGIKILKYYLNPGIVEIDGCNIENIYRHGIYVEGGVKAYIGKDSGNNINFNSDFNRAEAQNAILVSIGEDVTVSNNVIGGYSVSSSTSIYISSGSVDITGNTITDHNQYRDIYVNIGSTIRSTKVTTETAEAVVLELERLNSASVGIYDSKKLIYP